MRIAVLLFLSLALVFAAAEVPSGTATGQIGAAVATAFDCDDERCKNNAPDPPTCEPSRQDHNCNITMVWEPGGEVTITCIETNCNPL